MDNSTYPHKITKVSDKLARNKIVRMTWPAYFPDILEVTLESNCAHGLTKQRIVLEIVSKSPCDE